MEEVSYHKFWARQKLREQCDICKHRTNEDLCTVTILGTSYTPCDYMVECHKFEKKEKTK